VTTGTRALPRWRRALPRWREAWGLRVFADPRFVRLALGMVLLIALGYRVNQFIYFLTQPQWGYDFSAYWLAGRHVAAGEPLYLPAQLSGPFEPQALGQFLYLYPPFLAVAVAPLAALFPTYGPAMAVWSAAGAVVAAAVVLAVGRSEALVRDRSSALVLRGAAFVFPPLVAELILGNVHVLLLGLLAVAWLATRKEGRRAEAVAGVAVGIAALIKLFPAVVLVWFVLRGRWRAAAWGVAAALALAVATLPVVGLEPWLQYPRVILNLGAPANTADALAPSLWLGQWLPPLVARGIVVAVGLVAVAWSARALEERASYGVAVAACVLLAPAMFQHYLALMVLPLLLGLRVALNGPAISKVYLGLSYFAMWPGNQPLLGAWSWVLNRALPTLGALGVPVTLLAWGRQLGARKTGSAARRGRKRQAA